MEGKAKTLQIVGTGIPGGYFVGLIETDILLAFSWHQRRWQADRWEPPVTAQSLPPQIFSRILR